VAVHNAALCLVLTSGIVLICAYALLFSLPDVAIITGPAAGTSRSSGGGGGQGPPAASVLDGGGSARRRGGGGNGRGRIGGGVPTETAVKRGQQQQVKTVIGGNDGNGVGHLRHGQDPGVKTRTVAEPSQADAVTADNAQSGTVRATVAYAVSLTGCPRDDPLTDGGAVLKHSIHLQSASNPGSGSRYGYRMYAIVHPAAMECASQLEEVGYELLVRDVPVPVGEIRGDFLRTRVVDNGCCGEREYIKLHAYTLIGHPIVVHLDLDTIILRPMDVLFDAMLDTATAGGGERAATDIPIMFDKPLPPRVDAYFTRDYNMVKPGKPHVGVQGGFLVLRPSMEVYNNFADIIREGNFVEGKGWGGLGYGPFYGSLTFQGIVPYYYDELHPDTAVELNRCYYNAMADNPRDKKTVNDVVSGKCRDGREVCEDCREIDIGDISTAHFTLCQKPWSCLPHSQDMLQHRLCRRLHHEWFKVRADLEGKNGSGNYQPDQFFGFCNSSGGRGYIPIEQVGIR